VLPTTDAWLISLIAIPRNVLAATVFPSTSTPWERWVTMPSLAPDTVESSTRLLGASNSSIPWEYA
jgi:hypothetical protein